jgi:hypothetical protein
MTREITAFERFIDDLEEELVTIGHLALYNFSWYLRGQNHGLVDPTSEDAIAAMAERGYEHLMSIYELHLEWFDSPAQDTGVRAASDTPLDFDTHRDFETTELTAPFLVLVADDFEATATQVEANWARLASETQGSDG